MCFKHIWLIIFSCSISIALHADTTSSAQKQDRAQKWSQDNSTEPDEFNEPNKQKELYLLKGQYHYQVLAQQEQNKENTERSGVFVGVHIGTMSIDINKGSSLTTDGKLPQSIHPVAFGLSGGYMHFINNSSIGLRAYGQYLGAFSFAADIQDSVNSHLLSFNLDVAGDLAIGYEKGYFVGMYMGVGAGALFYNQHSTSEKIEDIVVGSVINLGLSATLKYHHRFEFGVKFPPSVFYSNYSLSTIYLAGYQYVF